LRKEELPLLGDDLYGESREESREGCLCARVSTDGAGRERLGASLVISDKGLVKERRGARAPAIRSSVMGS